MQDQINRRVFLGGSGGGLGFAALASLMKPVIASDATVANARFAPHFPPKAKRIIYLFQSGAPSQMDLFDPNLRWKSIEVRICQIQSGRASGSRQ